MPERPLYPIFQPEPSHQTPQLTEIVYPASIDPQAAIIPLAASSGVSSATLALTAPTTVPFAAASALASATLALTAPTYLAFNLQPNGDFEAGTSGYANDTGTIADSTVQVHGGSKSALVTRTTVGTGVVDAYDNTSARWPPATAGLSYTFWAWVYPTVTRNFSLQIQWRNGGFIDEITSSQVSCPAGQWTLLSVTGTAPTGTTKILPVVNGYSFDQGDTFYTDDWWFGPYLLTSAQSSATLDLTAPTVAEPVTSPVVGPMVAG